MARCLISILTTSSGSRTCPQRYAEHHNLCPDQATIDLHRRFNEKRGTLDWYCLEYWSDELAVNIRELKEEIQHLIQERPLCQRFFAASG